MSDLCDLPGCEPYPHYHSTVWAPNGTSAPAIVSVLPDGDGKVIRDSETGEIIFEARKDRVRVVPLPTGKAG